MHSKWFHYRADLIAPIFDRIYTTDLQYHNAMNVSSLEECAYTCYERPDCTHFNYKPEQNSLGTCILVL